MKEHISKKVRTFLNKKLEEGQDELVYGLSSYWGKRRGLGRWKPFYDASWFVQERLIQEFNYQECPCCHWATHHLDNHSWCQAQIKASGSIVE